MDHVTWHRYSFLLNILRLPIATVVYQNSLRSLLLAYLVVARLLSLVLVLTCSISISSILQTRILLRILLLILCLIYSMRSTITRSRRPIISCSWTRQSNRIFLSEGDYFRFARLFHSCRRRWSGETLSHLQVLGFYHLDKLQHKSDFAINGSVGSEELLDLEGWMQVKDLCEDPQDILHKGIVILRNQVIVPVFSYEVCHVGWVNQKQEVDRWQINTRVAGKNSVPSKSSLVSRQTQVWRWWKGLSLTYQWRCELCTSSVSVLASTFGPSNAIVFHFGASEECFVASLGIAIKHEVAGPCHFPKLPRSLLCMPARSNAKRIGVGGLSSNASF